MGSAFDIGDGTYTRRLYSDEVGEAIVTATVGGVVIDQQAKVSFLPEPVVTTSTIMVTTSTTTINASTTSTVTPSTSTTTAAETTSTTSSALSSSTTTSTNLLWPIAYGEMWGARKDENLILMRAFRDGFLLNTEVGREYIAVLYENSLEVATMLLQEPSLTIQAREVTDELLIKVESLLYNDAIEISQETINSFVS